MPLVFVVDDDVSVRRSTERLIRSLGMRAESFASAQDLLSSGHTIEPACLLVDVRMPGVGGLELLRHLRVKSQRTPVICFSARASQEDKDRALRSGAMAFLRKPVSKEELLRLVHMALESAKRATQLAKANEALRGCLDMLASVPELDDFLGQVMVAITGQLGAISCMLRVFSAEEKRAILELLFQDGRVMSPADAGYPEIYRSLPLAELGVANSVTVLHLTDPQSVLKPDGLHSYLVTHGVRTVLTIPLICRGEVNGVLRFRFAEDRDFQAEELEMARALATQASLAIQLTQLARSAKRSAVLEERNRLAGEIHDSLAQSFAGVCMHLGVAAEETQTNCHEVLEHIERAIDVARFGLAEARRSAFSLRSDVVEKSGLIDALKMLVERSNIPARLRCTFRTNLEHDERGSTELAEVLPIAIRQDLLRITQEAISNALRHAKPTAIDISLRLTPCGLILKVTDNGSGMKIGPDTREGFGFVNMRARVSKLHGSLKIRTAPGRGTSILVTVPNSLEARKAEELGARIKEQGGPDAAAHPLIRQRSGPATKTGVESQFPIRTWCRTFAS
jgi:signal transduction histidine kinase